MTQHDRDQRALVETANYWRAKHGQGNLSDDERRAFEAWLKQDIRHEEVYDQAETYWSAYDYLAVTDLDPALLRPSFSERVTAWLGLFAHWGRRPAIAIGAAAMVACLVVSFTWIYSNANRSVPPDAPIGPLDYASETGEVRAITLPDGSELTLAARSQVSIAFSDKSRVVTLVKGAALFDVESDPNRPFTVKSDHLSATAIGTQFEVSESAGIMRVSVSEGLVDVAFPLVVDGAITSLKSLRQVAAGEMVSASDRIGLSVIRAVDIQRIAAWRNNILYYDGATLREIIDDANRYSELEIQLEDLSPDLQAKSINASFQSTDLDGLLNTLTFVYPITIDRSAADKIVIRPSGAPE